MLKPMADKVVVKVQGDEESKRGGIIIPSAGDKNSVKRGTVVAVGPGKTENGQLVGMNVKLGDKVVFNMYAGNEVFYDEEDYLILSESDILATFE